MNERIELGDKAKDKLTGFEGIVSGRTDYLHGSSVLLVTSAGLKDGRPVSEWLEESRLKRLAAAE